MIFKTDLITLLRQDLHYGVPENLLPAMRAFGLPTGEPPHDYQRLLHELVDRILDLKGETEAFLSEGFIEPEALVALLADHELPVPAVLMPALPSGAADKSAIDQTVFDYYFDIACRNSATVTDPTASAYRNPLGRLLFRAMLSVKQQLGINPTARYILDHLREFDTEGIVETVETEAVVWKEGNVKRRMSLEAMARIMVNFKLPTLIH